MKKILLIAALLAFTATVFSQVNSKTVKVNSYTKSNGTYVQSYYKTAPNKTNWDNYSTTPNTNYNTGSKGYVPKDYSPAATNYGQGKTIYTGSRGGQYYINNNGNKTYVPKR